nr:MAG TPA: hypothetical protein [Caudoviricetes sp.]
MFLIYLLLSFIFLIIILFSIRSRIFICEI